MPCDFINPAPRPLTAVIGSSTPATLEMTSGQDGWMDPATGNMIQGLE